MDFIKQKIRVITEKLNQIKTGREVQWDATNPQFTVFVNGVTTQALDTNHTWLPLQADQDYDIYMYLYTGMINAHFEVHVSLETVDLNTEGLYYDVQAKVEKAGAFFDRIEADFRKNAEELCQEPKWVGEMYLEMHRGIYTSIAKNKKNNRKSELLYLMAESIATADMVLNGGSYPKETHDQKADVLLTPAFDYKEVYLCDMLEQNIRPLETVNGQVKLGVKNFEIVTLKFTK